MPFPSSLPEPWLRGILPDLDPVIAHLLRASEQIREDLTCAIDNLTPQQLWTAPEGINPAGFHARHIAGSTGRLCTYLEGNQLTQRELTALVEERNSGDPAPALIDAVSQSLRRYEFLIRALAPKNFSEIREVGRKRFPVTAISLAIHIAEHGHRHVGQIVSAAKLARSG